MNMKLLKLCALLVSSIISILFTIYDNEYPILYTYCYLGSLFLISILYSLSMYQKDVPEDHNLYIDL